MKTTKVGWLDRLRGKKPEQMWSSDVAENCNNGFVFLSDEQSGEPLVDIWFPEDLPFIKIKTYGGHDRISVDWLIGPDEIVWGGGEQVSYLALNGRKFPMWTSEPGVGREPGTALTDKMSTTGLLPEAIIGRRIIRNRRCYFPVAMPSASKIAAIANWI